MSTIKVNTITTRSGSTITLGESGKTIALACGASQTGFGRTGTVNWCTTAKTSPLTAESGKGYFINTTSGGITVTLPSSPSAGDIVAVSDYAGTAECNAITLCRNSSKFEGGCANKILVTNGDSVTVVYVDGTKGWKLVNTADQDILKGQFIQATGGTVLTCGNYKTHVFTSDSNFVVTGAGSSAGSNSVEYLVVAGGAGGGDGSGSAGGGAGGYRQNYPSPTTAGLPVSVQTYPITIGAGGTFSSSPSNRGSSGANSVFSTITSAGGGGGGSEGPNRPGNDGGSGGGGQGSGTSPSCHGNGGSGNTPPVSPPQGNNGGDGKGAYAGGGGGGASAVGGEGQPSPGAGVGGAGSPIADAFFGPTAPSYGTPGPSSGRYFAGGGGGGNQPPASSSVSPGGAGGGGAGALHPSTQAIAGTANSGGGGGGGISADPTQPNGSGGSGIVAIRYRFQ